jgi:uncharacterized protein (TIGR03435 family)
MPLARTTHRFSAKNMTAKLLMQLGWQTGPAKISAAPNWFSSDGFDIEAVADRPVTWGEMQRMLQSVLTSRFHLTFHRETKEGAVYELAVAKSGIKMKLATDQTPWTGDHPNQPGTTGASMDIREGRLAGDSIPLAMFINFLSGETGRPVINKTGLTGRYVIDLKWTSFRTPAFPDSAPDTSGESLFTAIQEQLGLKLVASKAPVQNIVIDHLEQPSEISRSRPPCFKTCFFKHACLIRHSVDPALPNAAGNLLYRIREIVVARKNLASPEPYQACAYERLPPRRPIPASVNWVLGINGTENRVKATRLRQIVNRWPQTDMQAMAVVRARFR